MVLGGKAEASNGAFHSKHADYLSGKRKVAGLKCHGFDSWEKLQKFVDHGKVGPREPLILLQIAHGELGGVALLNAGKEPSKKILSHLDRIARNRKVYSVIDSCYSGDLLREKLVSDALNPENPSIPNLCLTTASNFGIKAYISEYDPLSVLPKKANSGLNAEDVFKRSDEGLISSAQWDQAGITDYFLGYKIKEAKRVLSAIFDAGHSCDMFPIWRKSALLVNSKELLPRASGLLIDLKMHLNNYREIPQKELKLSSLDEQIKLLDERIRSAKSKQLNEQDSAKAKKLKSRIEALVAELDVMQDLRNRKGGVLRYNDLILAMDDFTKTAPFQNFHHLMADTPIDELDALGGALMRDYEVYKYNERNLQNLFGNIPLEQLWASGALSENSIIDGVSMAQRAILSDILGDYAFSGEEQPQDISDKTVTLEPEPTFAAFAFARGSIGWSDSTSKNDQKRRQACRDFRL